MNIREALNEAKNGAKVYVDYSSFYYDYEEGNNYEKERFGDFFTRDEIIADVIEAYLDYKRTHRNYNSRREIHSFVTYLEECESSYGEDGEGFNLEEEVVFGVDNSIQMDDYKRMRVAELEELVRELDGDDDEDDYDDDYE